MIIQAYQIQNVLRTYGHLDQLKTSQGEGETKQSDQSFPVAASLSEKVRLYFKIRGDLTESDDPQREQ